MTCLEEAHLKELPLLWRAVARNPGPRLNEEEGPPAGEQAGGEDVGVPSPQSEGGGGLGGGAVWQRERGVSKCWCLILLVIGVWGCTEAFGLLGTGSNQECIPLIRTSDKAEDCFRLSFILTFFIFQTKKRALKASDR